MATGSPQRFLLYDAPVHARLNEQRLYLERYASLARHLGRTLVLPRLRLHEHPPQRRPVKLAGFTRGGIPLPALDTGDADVDERAAEEAAAAAGCAGPGCAWAAGDADGLALAPLVRWSDLFNISALAAFQPVVELDAFLHQAPPTPTLILVGLAGCGQVRGERSRAGGWRTFNRARLDVSEVVCSEALPGMQAAAEPAGSSGSFSSGSFDGDPVRWEPSRSAASPEEWDWAVLRALRLRSVSVALAFDLRHPRDWAYHGTRSSPAPPHVGPLPGAMPALAAVGVLRPHVRFDGRFYAAAEAYAQGVFGEGGETEPYVAIHWRRTDFLERRANVSGALQSPHALVRHARRVMKRLGVRRAFLSTDSQEPSEIAQVLAKLRPAMLSRDDYARLAPPLAPPLPSSRAPLEQHAELRLAAAAAALDTALCARATYFLGSGTSHFTRAVLEERIGVFGHAPETAATLGDDHSASVARAAECAEGEPVHPACLRPRGPGTRAATPPLPLGGAEEELKVEL